MQLKSVAAVLAALALGGCPPTGTTGGVSPYLRVEEYFQGWQFIGAQFTPNVDVQLSVYNAPIPCGTSFCPSNDWQPIGAVRSGPVGGTYPMTEGQFHVVIQRDEMARRRGITVTCYPGETWTLNFLAKDPVTGRQAFHRGTGTAGFFGGTAPCPPSP